MRDEPEDDVAGSDDLRARFAALRQQERRAAPVWSPAPPRRRPGARTPVRVARWAAAACLLVAAGLAAVLATRRPEPRPDLARSLPRLLDGPPAPLFDTESLPRATQPVAGWSVASQSPSDAFLTSYTRPEIP